MTQTAGALVEAARARLVAADPDGARRERLGVRSARRGLFGLPRAPRIVPEASAWHLGVLLIGPDGVWGTGDVLRASDPGRRGFTAESARARAEIAREARRGGFAEGETVHLDWSAIDLATVDAGGVSGPLARTPQGVLVRWSPRGARMPLAAYLDERVGLLLDPPQGA